MPGMWMSISTSSGASSRSACSVPGPSARTPTSSSSGSWRTQSARPSLASGSSSAIRVVVRFMIRCRSRAGRSRRRSLRPAPSARRSAPGRRSRGRSAGCSAPRPTPPACAGASGGQMQPAPSSFTRSSRRSGGARRVHSIVHRAGFGARRDAVDDRVLDQRLQGQRRDRLLGRGLVDVPDHRQARAEAQRLEAEVVAHEVELLAQRHAVGGAAVGVEQVAQHPREAEQGALGRGRRPCASGR